jgi:hypothetical protein
VGVFWYANRESPVRPSGLTEEPMEFKPRRDIDSSGLRLTLEHLPRWKDAKSLDDIRAAFVGLAPGKIAGIDRLLSTPLPPGQEIRSLLEKTLLLLYEGKPREAYAVLRRARRVADANEVMAAEWRYTVIFLQGVTGLRIGENENCLQCRGEGACIFPLGPKAVHTNREGSRLAVRHFTEYLERFGDDLGVRWLLNLAYMTLGEHPRRVPPKYLLSFERFGKEADIGHFQDVAYRVGVDRFNQSGGAIMDDFDNDGLLDLVVTSWDAGTHMAYYRNKGDGTFEDCTKAAGLDKQYGGLNAVQTDYNNDGNLDIFIPRGAWHFYPMRPSLLRNNGDGTFTDVTAKAGLMDPVNSPCGTWADYDNDGFLDLYLCNEKGPNRLYRNRGDGTFEEVAARAGVQGKQEFCKGAVWFDYDNDGYPDLFVSYLNSTPQLFHNNRDGTFTDVTEAVGIEGPRSGFSCWAFDYNNDGWLDLFVTSYDGELGDLVADMQGPHRNKEVDVSRLYRNHRGKYFEDVSRQAGVAKVFRTMGCNFADFDNDGYLDFYLGTGAPPLSTVVPNRMFKNVAGKRFADITATSGTGHLQKGHGVACGDWRRCGSVDLFMEVGGATPGDQYHNVLFLNPGQGNHWLTVKLVGRKSNRPAIGARIKVVTAGDHPLTVYRHVTSGSSFGANPLQQTIGLGRARSVATLEIHWPTSRTTQVFRDVAADQAVEVTEFATGYRKLHWTVVPIRGRAEAKRGLLEGKPNR